MDNGTPELEEAERYQRELAQRVVCRPLRQSPRTVVGLDAAYDGDVVCAAAALFSVAPLRLLEERTVLQQCPFPYMPGYLFRREAPALMAALAALSASADLLLVEGQGVAHPRRCGLACYLGIEAGIPTIGCAKTRLIGAYEEPGREKGSWSPLCSDGEVIGAVVKTRTDVKPLYVSVGHLVTLEDAVDLVLRLCGEFRIPEPLRAADMAARREMRELID